MSFVSSHRMVSDFRQRVIADGGLISDNELNALYYWCNENEKNQLLSSYIAYYPFVGGDGVSASSIANFRHNLISSSYKLTNVGGITAAMCTSKGFKSLGNVNNQYWQVALTQAVNLSLNSFHLSAYSRTNLIGTGGLVGNIMVEMFAAGGGDQIGLGMWLGGASGNVDLGDGSATNGGAAARLIISSTSSLGQATLSRISSSDLSLYKNKIKTGTTAVASSTAVTGNFSLASYGGNNISRREYGMFSLGFGLTESQVITSHTIEQITQQYLNRAITF